MSIVSEIKTTITFLILFSSIQWSFGQTKLLKGTVTAKDGDVTGITVQNINSGSASITDTEGNFAIKVTLNDTLVFSSVQFKRKKLPINKAIFNTSLVRVVLEEFVNELQEVVVQPYNLSGNLNSDITGLSLSKDVSAESLGLPNANVRIVSQSENKLNDADHGRFLYFYGVGFAVNVNKILNRLSGRTKMLKERVALDKAYSKTQKIEEKFIDSVLVNYLRIPKNDFYDFIYFCEMDEAFKALASENDELKLWQFLIVKSKTYRKNNGLE